MPTTQGTIVRTENDTWATVFQGLNNQGSSTELLVGNIFFGINGYPFMVFGGHNIPPKAIIQSASITMVPTLTQLGTVPTTINTAPRDQRWEVTTSRTGWSRAVYFDLDARVIDDVSGLIVDTVGGTIAFPVLRFSSPGKHQRIAQRFNVASASTLGSVELQVNRVGSPVGDAYVEIYDTDPTTNEPTGDALATSDLVDASTISTAFSTVSFDFTGGEQIALSAKDYALVFRGDWTADGVNYLQVRCGSGFIFTPYTDGEMWLYGEGRGLDDQNYPGQADLYIALASTRPASINVAWTIPVVAAGVPVTTPSLKEVVQNAVDDPLYTEDGGSIAIAIISTGSVNRRFASFDHATLAPPVLDVTWERLRSGIFLDASEEKTIALPASEEKIIALPASEEKIIPLPASEDTL